MGFREPLVLVGLALLPLAVLAYVAAQRRRRRFAVRYTNVDLLASRRDARARCATCPRCSRCSRSRRCSSRSRGPERTVAAKREEATVIMVTDTSGSMLAKDVRPGPADRRARGGADAHPPGAGGLPARADQVRLAAPSRSSSRRPTATRMELALRQLSVAGRAPRWATGSSSGSRRRRRRSPTGSAARASCRPRSCCSPTARARAARTRSTSPSRPRRPRSASTPSRSARPSGTLETTRPDGTTRSENVPPDTLTLQEIARDTGGRYFNAPDADQLEAVYSGLATRFATVQREAGDDRDVRRRRARAAARRAGVLAAARGAAAVSRAPARSSRRRPTARPSAPGPAPSRRRSCARSTSPSCAASRA